uniref:Myb-like domain-containing protein n=1 Tax=Cyclopterus lumpus TaxID=8103 RepID=A0A8C2ZHM2_CYCLU
TKATAPSFLDECLQSFFPPEDMKGVVEHHRNLARFLPMDDCILSSLSLPPGTKPVTNTTSCSPSLKDSNSPEHKRHLDALFNTSSLERAIRRSSETVRQRLEETGDLGSWQLQVGVNAISQINLNFGLLTNSAGFILDSQEGSFPVVMDTKVPWSDEETLNLLDIWGKDSVQRALKGCLKNRHIFTQIAQKMAERGYIRTVLKEPSSFLSACLSVQSSQFIRSLYFPRQISYLVPWTDFESLALITTWGEDKMQRELRGMHRNGNIFSIISNNMAAQGFSRTPEQCQTRLKRLKSNFRQCYQNNMKGQEQVECKFYNELGSLLVKDFPSVPQLEEIPEEPEDTDSLLFSHQDFESAVGVPEDRKKVPWSDKETIILLEIWGDPQVQQSMRRYPHNGHIFTEISEKLSANGYSRSAGQCHTRIKRLKANYRHCQDNLNSPGTDRVDFKFYDLLEQILDKQPSTSSTVLTDSIEISEDSNGESKPTTSSWSDEETLALIEIWGDEDVQTALRDFVHNGHIYADISQRLCDLGFSKTSEQCRWKVKSLRNHFRQCYDRKKCGRRVDYRFYHQLEQILNQEAVSIDDYDEKDQDQEQADQDPGTVSRKMPWSDRETRTLLEIWGEDTVQLTLKGCLKNRHVFEYISEKMSDRGFIRTSEQCYTRIKRLKHGFLHEKSTLQPVSHVSAIAAKEACRLLSICYSETSTLLVTSGTQWVPDSTKLAWSDGETEVLLDIWGSEEIQETLKGCTKNKHIFIQISEVMASQGYLRTPEQCQTRIKRLRANFRHFLEGEKQECKFFDQLVQIFGSKYATNSDPLADDTADGVGKKPHRLTVVHLVCVMQWLYQLNNASGHKKEGSSIRSGLFPVSEVRSHVTATLRRVYLFYFYLYSVLYTFHTCCFHSHF